MRDTLRTRHQFQQVYAEGAKSVGRYQIVFVLPRPETLEATDPGYRRGWAVGVVASRKVGGAVARNRAKRHLRASFQRVCDDLTTPVWVVLVARAAASRSDVHMVDVAEEMVRLMDQLGVISRPPTSSGSGASS